MTARAFRILGGTAALAAVVVVSGCSGDEAGTTSAVASAQPAASGGRAAFTECLRDHGVTPPTGRPSGRPGGHLTARPSGPPSPRLPERGRGGFDTTNPALRQAMQACASLRPTPGPGEGFGRGRSGGRDDSALRAFRTCMKDNGADLAPGAVRDQKTPHPAIDKALEKCRPLLPARPTPSPGA